MPVVINGTTGITSPGETVTGNLSVNQSTGGFLTTDGAAQTNIQLNTTTSGAFNWRLTNEGNAGRLRFLGTDGVSNVFPMFLNTGGQVTTPSQPRLACNNANTNGTGLSGAFAIGQGVPELNTGSCFNTTTRLFTCPIAGNYRVSVSASSVDAQSHYIGPVKNGAVLGAYSLFYTNFNSAAQSVIVPCAAGDTLAGLSRYNTGLYGAQISIELIG